MTATPLSPLSLIIAAIVTWLAIGALGLVRPRDLRLISHALFPVGAAVALALAIVDGYAIDGPPAACTAC